MPYNNRTRLAIFAQLLREKARIVPLNSHVPRRQSCTQCGAGLPAVQDGPVRCDYCGSIYYFIDPPAGGEWNWETAAAVAELQQVNARAVRALRGE